MRSALLQCVRVAIEMACDGGTLFSLPPLFLIAVTVVYYY
jgi:hypothetical protein